MARLSGLVEKGWGSELIWATTDNYCGKFLRFNREAEFSLHFHAEKDETWYVLEGTFVVTTIDTKTSKVTETLLIQGETWHNPPLTPHKLKCLTQGTIIEVSTADSEEDNYRIAPGDSQR